LVLKVGGIEARTTLNRFLLNVMYRTTVGASYEDASVSVMWYKGPLGLLPSWHVVATEYVSVSVC
jgi:hypothetical protein